jgi:hypothetical protein
VKKGSERERKRRKGKKRRKGGTGNETLKDV